MRLVVLCSVAVVLGVWSLRIARRVSKFNTGYLISATCGVTVVGVMLAGLVGAALFGVPLVCVVFAWDKARAARIASGDLK